MRISAFVEFVPLGLGNIQPARSWTLTSVAMTYVSMVLFTKSDED